MNERLKQWLKKQLEALVSVQRCSFTATSSLIARAHEPDLIVFMWTGVRIHIYIVTEPYKPRAIKTIIQADTNHGIGSLFIVNPAILPRHDEFLKPEEWLLAICALTRERIYTYKATQDGLLSLRFEQIGLSENYRAVYDAPVVIRQLSYSRVTVRPRAVKGFWIIADFGSESGWKKQAPVKDYYPPRSSQSTRQSSANSHSENNHREIPPEPPTKTRLESAYELLGVKPDATREEIKSAFRKQAFLVHPDVSELEKPEAEARFKALTEAYEMIKSANDWA
jgi:DnaJ-domain-containing protein 1